MRGFLTSLLVALGLTVGSVEAAPGWSASGSVTNVRVFENGHIFGELSASLYCTSSTFLVDPSLPVEHRWQIFSVILSANAKGLNIQVFDTNNCGGGASQTIISGARLAQSGN